MDDSKKLREHLVEKIRLNNVALVRGCVYRLLLARYGALLKAEMYRMGQGDSGTALENFHVFPSYESGDVQPLVEHLQNHKQYRGPMSPGLCDFLIDVVQGKKPLTKGPKKSTAVEQRNVDLAIRVAAYMWLDDLPLDKAYPKVAEDTDRSERMVSRAYERFARYFSQKTPNCPDQDRLKV